MASPRHATPIDPRRDAPRGTASRLDALRRGLQQIQQNLQNTLRKKKQQQLLGGIAACCLLLGLSDPIQSRAPATEIEAETERNSITLAIALPAQAANEEAANTAPTNRKAVEKNSAVWQKHIQSVRRGDNLSALFQRVGLSDRDVYQVVKSGAEGRALKRMYPGEKLEFWLGENNQLEKVSRVQSPLQRIDFIRDSYTDKNGVGKSRYRSEKITRQAEIKTVYRSAFIDDSLSLSAQRAKVSPTITLNMATIFGGVIDFALDVRKGDQFTVIYQQRYLDGKKLDDGHIVAARYINRGKVYNAYRYRDPSGEVGYYNEDGVSMRKAFLRAPLDFTRISSGFNLKRLHPITKRVKPHRGIDYAAPRGTPVFATGNGRVVASARGRANGNYIFINHGENYTTKYLHLHKRNVKVGQRVKQGQVIGQVGCTGSCTGPHLHYEFVIDGVHRNPRTVVKKLPRAKRLSTTYRRDFLTAIEPTQVQLAHYSGLIKLASRE